jgi:hypothetical protein
VQVIGVLERLYPVAGCSLIDNDADLHQYGFVVGNEVADFIFHYAVPSSDIFVTFQLFSFISAIHFRAVDDDLNVSLTTWLRSVIGCAVIVIIPPTLRFVVRLL